MEQVRCSTTPQSEQTIRRRQFVHKQPSLTPLFLQRTHAEENLTRHQERQQTIVSTRNVPRRKRRWHTKQRSDGSHLPTPQAYRSFWKNRQWAIGSQAFEALSSSLELVTRTDAIEARSHKVNFVIGGEAFETPTFIMGVDNKHMCNRRTTFKLNKNKQTSNKHQCDASLHK